MKKLISTIIVVAMLVTMGSTALAAVYVDSEISFNDTFDNCVSSEITSENVSTVLGNGWSLSSNASNGTAEIKSDVVSNGKALFISQPDNNWNSHSVQKTLDSAVSGNVKISTSFYSGAYAGLNIYTDTDKKIGGYYFNGSGDLKISDGTSEITPFTAGRVKNVFYNLVMNYDTDMACFDFELSWPGTTLPTLDDKFEGAIENGRCVIRTKAPISINATGAINIKKIVASALKQGSMYFDYIKLEKTVSQIESPLYSEDFNEAQVGALTEDNITTVLNDGWSIYTEEDVSTDAVSIDNTKYATNSLKISKNGSTNWKSYGVKKTFDTVYTGKIVVEGQFHYAQYANIELYNNEDKRISGFFINGSNVGQLQYGTQGSEVKDVFEGSLPNDIAYSVKYLIDTVEKTMSFEVTYPGTVLPTAKTGFTATLNNGTVKVSTTDPVTISQNVVNLNSIRMVCSKNVTTYVDNISIKKLESIKAKLEYVKTLSGQTVTNFTEVPATISGIELAFDYPIKSSTLNNTNIKLVRDSDSEEVIYVPSIIDSGKKYIMTFNEALEAGDYTLSVSNLYDVDEVELDDITPITFTAQSVAKLYINENFTDTSKYVDGTNLVANPINGWNFADAYNGSITIGNKSNQQTMLLELDSAEGLSPSVEIPFVPQTGIIEVEYTYAAGPATPQPYVELYSGDNRRIRIASPWRTLCAITGSTDSGEDVYCNFFGTGDGALRFGGDSFYTVKLAINTETKTYDISVTTDNLANYTGPKEDKVTLNGTTATVANVPLTGTGLGIDKLKFGMVANGSAGYEFGIKNLRVETLTACKKVTLENNSEISDGAVIPVLTQKLNFDFTNTVNIGNAQAQVLEVESNVSTQATLSLANSGKTVVLTLPQMKPGKSYKVTFSGLVDEQNCNVSGFKNGFNFVAGEKPLRATNIRKIGTTSGGIKFGADIVNEYSSSKSVALMAALYSNTGAMKAFDFTENSISSTVGDDPIPITVVLPTTAGIEANDYIKVYVWNSMSLMNRIENPTDISLQ